MEQSLITLQAIKLLEPLIFHVLLEVFDFHHKEKRLKKIVQKRTFSSINKTRGRLFLLLFTPKIRAFYGIIVRIELTEKTDDLF